MTDSNEPIKILAPPDAVDRISRRLFMGGAAGAAVAGSALLSACGDDAETDTERHAGRRDRGCAQHVHLG